MSQPSPKTIDILIGILCLLWGSTWIVIKEGLKDLPPYTSAGVRFAVAGVLMVFVAMALGKKESGDPPNLKMTASIGVLNFAASYGIVYWSETVLPSGLVAVLWGSFPMMMAFMAHKYLGERLRGAQWGGFVVGFAGVALLFVTDLVEFDVEGLYAAAILLLSPLVCAVSTTYIKLHGSGTNSMLLDRNGMLLGAALLLLVAVLTERDAAFAWTTRAVLSVAYLAVVGTVITFSVYFWLLRYADANRLGLIAYVTPVIALFLGWIGGETVTWYSIAGTAMIIGGVLAVAKRR